MATRQALVLNSGIQQQILNADTLAVGSGITTESGNLTLNSASGDMSFTARVASNVTFDDNTHSITATTVSSNTNAVAMLVLGSTGGHTTTSSPAGNGSPFQGCAGGGGAAGASSGAAGTGGTTIWMGGPGGPGTATGISGAGGALNLLGGFAGLDGGAGGNNGGIVYLDGGVGTGSGTNGPVSIASQFASALFLGYGATLPVTIGGLVTFGGFIANGELEFSTGGILTAPIQPTDASDGFPMGVIGGQGSAASDVGPVAAGNGSYIEVYGGTGGDGSSTEAAGNGGTVFITGGEAGVDNGGGGANSGGVVIDSFAPTSGGSPGVISIAPTTATTINIGNSGSTVNFTGTVTGIGGGISGSGTTNTIPVWASSSSVTDSGITDDGTTVGIAARALTWTPNGNSSIINSAGSFELKAHTALTLDSATSGIGVGSTTASTISVGNSTSQTIITGAFSQGTGAMALGPSGNSSIIVSSGSLEIDSTSSINIGDQFAGAVNIGRSGWEVGFYGTAAHIQPATTGTTTVTSAGSGTALKADTTSTGGSGSTAYTTADVILALKQVGLLAP